MHHAEHRHLSKSGAERGEVEHQPIIGSDRDSREEADGTECLAYHLFRSGNHYYFEIMLPGSILGAVVGWATQKYGRSPETATAS